MAPHTLVKLPLEVKCTTRLKQSAKRIKEKLPNTRFRSISGSYWLLGCKILMVVAMECQVLILTNAVVLFSGALRVIVPYNRKDQELCSMGRWFSSQMVRETITQEIIFQLD